MNSLEGYRVMYCFLDSIYLKTKADELGGLLGCMSLTSDNTPVDQACIKDWEVAISQVVEHSKVDVLTSDSAYWAMVAFLRNWAALGKDGTVSRLCGNLENGNSNSDEWLDAVNTVIAGNDDPYLRLLK